MRRSQPIVYPPEAGERLRRKLAERTQNVGAQGKEAAPISLLSPHSLLPEV
jgi:hypothetical protein